MPRRVLIVVAGAAALLASVVPPGAAAGAATGSAATAQAATPALKWHACHDGAECATLPVSLDDTVTGGPTIDLALVRYRARDSEHRIGSLVMNPGGPGASGVDYVVDAASTLPAALRDRFDIVGFDPRGVGRSDGVECTKELDPFYALDWAPRTDAQRAQLVAGVRRLVDACEQKDGAILPYLSTQRAARDLDRIRAALGDAKLTYLGYSYGTYLGAWYAQQFPGNVRALVLDGAVDPALDATAVQVQQAVGFEQDLDLFLRHCSHDTHCAFHRGGHTARAYDRLRTRVDARPLPADGAGHGRTLNGTEFDLGVTQLLYEGRSAWSDLADALARADHGDGSDLLGIADTYTGRSQDGSYDDTQDAFLAIGCADGPPVGGVDGLRVIEEQAARAAPRLGRSIVNNSLACALWPVPGAPPLALHAAGAAPIVVLGTRNDPATPLVWAEGLAKELDSGVLVTAGGERHTAFAAGNECIDRSVVRYLVDLSVPGRGTRC